MRGRMLRCVLFLLLPLTAGAKVALASAESMSIRHKFRIAAPAAQAWESLIHPERWWPADHTWSGKRESLSPGATAGGSAKHGRIIMAIPNHLLRLDAAHKLDALAPIVE